MAVRPSSVRAGCELGSEQLGILREGETVTELERRELAGTVRIRCDRGWVSLASGHGTVLLRSAVSGGEAQEGRTCTSANDLHQKLLSLQRARSAGRGASTPRFDAESMVADLITQARCARSHPPPPLTPPTTMSGDVVQSPDALHARHARAVTESAKVQGHDRAVVEEHAMQTARDAFAVVRAGQRTLPQEALSPTSASLASQISVRHTAFAERSQYTFAAATPRADSFQHSSDPASTDPIERHDAGLSKAVQAAVEQERAAGEEAFRKQLMALRTDAAAQLAQAQAAAQDAAKEAQIRHEAAMATAVQQATYRVQQETDQVYRLRTEGAELRAKTEYDAELQRARSAAAAEIEAARRQAAADATEACRAHYKAEVSEAVQAAVEQERAAGEEAFRKQLMALRTDAAAQLAQAQAAAQDAAKEAQIRHEAAMATAVQQATYRVQQETDQVYRLRTEGAELRAKTEYDAELQRARSAAAAEIEAARRQAAADATEACRAHYKAEVSEAVQAAVEQERAAGEKACAKLKAVADENLRAQLQAASMKASQQLGDALAAASLETEASIEAAVQAATIRTKRTEEQQHLLQVEELQKDFDAQRENAVLAAVRESVAQSEAQLEQERTKSRHTRELAADQARLEATQAERQVASTRLGEAQKEISHHRLQAETLRVKLAQAEASSAARQEDAVRNAQEMARRELDTAIANATREHQAQIQRVSQQAQQARTELAREIERVREAEKSRYDSQIAELERSIDGRMQGLHATARAHIEAEVAESLERTWAELEHAGTMLSKVQQGANPRSDGRRSTEMAIHHAPRQVHETQYHDVAQADDSRSRSRQKAVAAALHSRGASVEQDPAYIRVRTRNLEAARSRARAQSANSHHEHR